MPRAYPQMDYADPARDSGTGEWQALRGELVALLDKVESHYGQAEAEPVEPAMTGLARRVRTLRDQMDGTESALRRREALQTVKRAVDRFSDREDEPMMRPAVDNLTAAIAEIRSRQGVQARPVARMAEMPELRELGSLVGGMSQRLERLEGELKAQRSNSGQVREVASQVEQLTQVVELLAGAVGETGQVKRLEVQIAALGAMIEDAPRVDLAAINGRLDDVSATVGKLAELQAQQMEREITRDSRQNLAPEIAKVVPAMDAIEAGVRTVYDRIDAIERSVALSSADFERLTSEMAAFTQAMRDKDSTPDALVARIEALSEQLTGIDSGSGDVAGLKADIAALRGAVVQTMEPRFLKLESQIEALSEKIAAPVDSGAVEAQLKALMARMDDAGAQLDGLARLYNDRPAPVAVFGPESLKSIEDRLTGLIKSAGKTPDYDTLAEMIATRASEAVSKAAPAGGAQQDGIEAMEKRMTALLNTAGKDTAERLARLEAALTGRTDLAMPAVAPMAKAAPEPVAKPVPAPVARQEEKFEDDDPFAAALQPKRPGNDRLDAILADLDRDGRDAMPINPAVDAPLIDTAGKPAPRPAAKPVAAATAAALKVDAPAGPPRFDPSLAQKPPRPVSSFASENIDPFAEPVSRTAAPEPAAPTPTSTSTFVAAARRAQRAKQEEQVAATNSIIGRALSRVKARKTEETEPVAAAAAPVAPLVAPAPLPAAETRISRKEQREAAKAAREAAKAERAAAKAKPAPVAEGEEETQSFLTRHRRPLLLAATLVAVSMLALNLVMERSERSDTAPAEAPQVSEPEAAPADGDQSSVVPPRVIDRIDPTSTGSINPGEPMTFSRAALTSRTTPVPPTLGALSLDAPGTSLETAGSIPQPAVAEAAASFELPPEGIGPEALRQAAAAGNAQAQFEVAAILGEGRAMAQDFEAAATWYERSAAQGFVPAQYRMGNLYEMGTGVEKDLEQARLWYQRGAEAGNRMAMHNLAALYAGGQLGDQQFELAAEWFEKAANQGMTDSQFNLGMLYARGLGVEQSFEQSFKWFSLAARNGDTDAAQARDDIAKSLTADAVSRIEQEVESWKIGPVDFAANFAPMGTWSPDFDPGAPITGSDVVARVQQALVKLGFDIGTPDGVAGPKTAEAIKAFERATGMSEVGAINPRLLAVLGSQPV